MFYDSFMLQHLAHPNSRILAIIGTGVQAYGHFEALILVQHFDEVSAIALFGLPIVQFTKVIQFRFDDMISFSTESCTEL